MRTQRLLASVLLGLSACAGDPGSAEPDAADSTALTAPPDGTTGVEEVIGPDHLPHEIHYVVKHGHKLWGDIDLGEAAAPGIHPDADAVTNLALRWPRGVIHWRNDAPQLVAAVGTAKNPGVIRQTMTTISSLVPITFVEGTGSGSDQYLSIRYNSDEGGQSTCVGMCGTGHGSNAEPIIYWHEDVDPPTAAHELGHLMGFTHEQERSDRDMYVDVDVANNCTVSAGNFDVVNSGYYKYGDYDFNSIMEYPSYATCQQAADLGVPPVAGTTCACLPTIRKGYATNHYTTQQTDPAWIAGGSDLSPRDVRALTQMYEPTTLGNVETGDAMGASVVVADFNGDGLDDVAVGSPGEAPFGHGSGGAVFVYMGGLDGPMNWRVLTASDFGDTPTAGDQFGAALAAHDIDSDGKYELVVGAPGRNGAGEIFVYQGMQTGPLAKQRLTQGNSGAGVDEPGDLFGTSLAFGNFDGTHAAALAVGAPHDGAGSSHSGYVFLLQWKNDGSAAGLVNTTTLGTTSGYTAWTGLGEPGTPGSSDQFGAALDAPVFGYDGGHHLVVGAPGANKVDVYTGLALTITATGSVAGDQFGASLAHGDFNGDGYVDLAVGAPGVSGGAGRVYTYAGINNALLLTFAGTVTEASVPGMAMEGDAHFGAALAAADLDGDGKVDLVVGTPQQGTGGALDWFKGSTATALLTGKGTSNETASGNSAVAGDHFGAAVAIGKTSSSSSYDVVGGAPGANLSSQVNAGAWFYALGVNDAASTWDLARRTQGSSLAKR